MINYTPSDIAENIKIADIRDCLCIETKIYEKKEIIIHISESSKNLGIIDAGKAYLIRIDFDGRRNIIDYYEAGDIFGKLLIPYADMNTYYVLAKTKCKISFLNYDKLINKCKNNCDKHNIFFNNIILSAFLKTQTHIDILSQRSIKAKLITFFEYLKSKKKSGRLTLPLPLSDLADYLSVDRSAMMRELKKLKEDGIVDIQGNNVLFNKYEDGN